MKKEKAGESGLRDYYSVPLIIIIRELCFLLFEKQKQYSKLVLLARLTFSQTHFFLLRWGGEKKRVWSNSIDHLVSAHSAIISLGGARMTNSTS